jgi:hypothetical protein
MMQYLIQSIKDATNKPIPDKSTEKEIKKMYDIAKRHLPIEHAIKTKEKIYPAKDGDRFTTHS